MSASIRAAVYFYLTVTDQPGVAYGLLSKLAAEAVNLLAFNAIPIGPDQTQLALFPENVKRLAQAAEALGLALAGPHRAFLIQGDDKLGAFAEIHSRLLDSQINVYASSGVTDGRGGYGYVLYVRPEEYKAAAQVLGV